MSHRCSLCGASLSQFLWTGKDNDVTREMHIVGGGFRKTLCPVCSSNDRDRLVWLFLYRQVRLHTMGTLRLLHVAPERQLQRRLRSLPNVVYVAGDRFAEGYEYPSGTVPLDVTRLPFRPTAFDIVICNHVFEHVATDREAMREIYRVMKPGGLAILQVPIARELTRTYEDDAIRTPGEREAAFGQHDHRRLYGQDYEERLRATGFLVERTHPQDEVEGVDIDKEALNQEEEIFAARRPPSD